jgi:glucose/arabinose dehydrogenase
MRRAGTLAIVIALAAVSPSSGQPPVGDGNGGIVLRSIGRFEQPVYVDDAPGYEHLLFVVEKAGRVKVVRNGNILDRHFLDISDIVSSEDERGLLSIAFPPGYPDSRRFYVYFTNTEGDVEIDEFKRRRHVPSRAKPSSRRLVIEIPHPNHANHNGGTITFGPNGRLYAAPGDGGGAGDPGENAQDLDSLLGKLLRIDPEPHGSKPYTVPEQNPYVGLPGRNEIFALGLRNPYRFSFDELTGDLTIGDVGQSAWEEVDLERLADAKGANFGWDNYEGTHLFEGPELIDRSDPVLEYPNPNGSSSAVTGGIVVRDERLTSLYGRYLYADFYTGQLRSFVPDVVNHMAVDDHAVGPIVFTPAAFVAGSEGRVYIPSLQGGHVYRVGPTEPAPSAGRLP